MERVGRGCGKEMERERVVDRSVVGRRGEEKGRGIGGERERCCGSSWRRDRGPGERRVGQARAGRSRRSWWRDNGGEGGEAGVEAEGIVVTGEV